MSASALRRPEAEETAALPGAASETKPVLDTSVAARKFDFAEALRVISTSYGKTYQQVLMEVAKCAFGPGKLAFGDYLTFRLFDDAPLAGADKTQFVGLDASRRIWLTANFDQEWWGIMQNKLAITTLLGGYGFPVIPTQALFSESMTLHNAPVLRDAGALARYLRDASLYPLFGKPMDAIRSLGSASFQSFDGASDELVALSGVRLPVEAFAKEVAELFPAGYLLQKRVTPHADMRAIVGDRLATVRVLTIRGKDGARVHRAVWKIIAGSNVADNFWRGGNLLATLDLETGRVVRVVRGTGLAQEHVSTHPDSGAELMGFEIPRWKQICEVACEAAGVLGGIRLVGWDMAVTDSGVTIVEPNYTPDFDMVQMADRRGILDAPFLAFLEECKDAARAAKRKQRNHRVVETRERLRQFSQSLGG